LLPKKVVEILNSQVKKLPNVVGYSKTLKRKIVKGRETDIMAIRIYVEKKLPEAMLKPAHIIPKTIEDIPTDVIEIGKLQAPPSGPLEPKTKTVDKTQKFRPVIFGISIGHMNITAGCLTSDALVFGNPEIKPITEFKEGDRVFVFSDNGIVERKVRSVFNNGVKDVYLLKTQTGREIKATGNHPFLVARRVPNEYYEKYKRTLELKETLPNYKIAKLLDVSRRTIDHWVFGRHKPRPYRWVLKWVSLGELKTGDYIVVLKESPMDGKPLQIPRIETSYQYPIPKEMDNDLMWFFGYYLADGCVAHKKFHDVVQIAEGNEKKANALISKLKKYKIHARYDAKRRQVEISSTYLARLIEKLSLTGNAHTKRIPNWILGLPKEQIKSFIIGFIFGDGSRHRSKTHEVRFDVELCNRELLEQLKFLCQMVGWRTNNIRYRRRLSVMKDGRLIEGDTYCLSVYLPITPKSRRLKGSLKINLKLPEYFGLDKIVEISYFGKENTYDLEIDGDEHNFIANNIVVHNSNGFPYVDKNGNEYFGSNSHVLCDDPSKKPEEVSEKRILQPGPWDIRQQGGNVDDPDYVVAEYVWHEQIYPIGSVSGCPVASALASLYNALARIAGAKTRLKPTVEMVNHIDFAVAKPLVDYELKFPDFNVEGYKLVGHGFAGSDQTSVVCKIKYIIEKGYMPKAETGEPKVGDILEKSGRTSCYTKAKVIDESAQVQVSYDTFAATFDDVILTEKLLDPGDSGSSAWIKVK
jgi:intein/homing endonuclease